ncbi:MAG TPA: peptidoglycan-binding protein [Candidatus Paceibacterota bacterium]|nr:peptidoglycan-binding protein [Candidatus Paceibacterota bacterium]
MKKVYVAIVAVVAAVGLYGQVAAAGCVDLKTSLYIGRRNSEVALLQRFLYDRGLLAVSPTGYFGFKTMAAVRAFQGQQGLSQVGVAGPLTRAKIKTLSCAGSAAGLRISSVMPDQAVSLPLVIKGTANGGGWNAFEGEVGSVRLLDAAGKTIATGILTVQGEWMQPNVKFETVLRSDIKPSTPTGSLVFVNSNASGLAERDRTHVIPVRFASLASENMAIKIALLDDSDSSANGKVRACDKVVMANRTVNRSPAVLDAALRELFSYQPANSLRSFVASQANLKFSRVVMDGSTAKIYLTGSIGPLGGVCDDPRLQIQLEETAFQFDTVRSAKVYVNNVLQDWNYTQR